MEPLAAPMGYGGAEIGMMGPEIGMSGAEMFGPSMAEMGGAVPAATEGAQVATMADAAPAMEMGAYGPLIGGGLLASSMLLPKDSPINPSTWMSAITQPVFDFFGGIFD
jgi:hypothetical protein